MSDDNTGHSEHKTLAGRVSIIKKHKIAKYKIDTSVRVPDYNGGRRARSLFTAKLPLEDMNIGDSFVVPKEELPAHNTIWAMLGYRAEQVGITLKFMDNEDGSIRVWRTA